MAKHKVFSLTEMSLLPKKRGLPKLDRVEFLMRQGWSFPEFRIQQDTMVMRFYDIEEVDNLIDVLMRARKKYADVIENPTEVTPKPKRVRKLKEPEIPF